MGDYLETLCSMLGESKPILNSTLSVKTPMEIDIDLHNERNIQWTMNFTKNIDEDFSLILLWYYFKFLPPNFAFVSLKMFPYSRKKWILYLWSKFTLCVYVCLFELKSVLGNKKHDWKRSQKYWEQFECAILHIINFHFQYFRKIIHMQYLLLLAVNYKRTRTDIVLLPIWTLPRQV